MVRDPGGWGRETPTRFCASFAGGGEARLEKRAFCGLPRVSLWTATNRVRASSSASTESVAGLQIKDAVILEQLLMLEPSYAARRLASRLTAAIVTGSQVKLNLATHQSTLRRDLIEDRYRDARLASLTNTGPGDCVSGQIGHQVGCEGRRPEAPPCLLVA